MEKNNALQSAKDLQEYCDSKMCIECMFENSEGYCEVGYPTSWDFDEIGEDKDVYRV